MVKRIILIYTFILFPFIVSGQITIGTGKPANLGSLLDLKQSNTIGANSTKGLLLPRVNLKDINYLYPMFAEGYDKNVEDLAHTGLTVYNVNNCFSEGVGPYAWDGEKWNLLIQQENSEVLTFEDQDGNPFLARQFGDAGIWMIQNLAARNYDTRRDSDDTSIHTDKDIKYPNNKESLFIEYPWMGVFYDYHTAINNSHSIVNSKRIQGMCPYGWHVPSSEEWGELENELIKNTQKYTTEKESYLSNGVPLQKLDTIAKNGNVKYGEKFRPMVLDPCPVPNTDTKINGVSLKNTHGGFAIRMVGAVDNNGAIDGYGIKAGFWLATKSTNGNTGRNRVYINSETFTHNNGGDMKRHYSIRCKKNE